jgi:hypothetical protein
LLIEFAQRGRLQHLQDIFADLPELVVQRTGLELGTLLKSQCTPGEDAVAVDDANHISQRGIQR